MLHVETVYFKTAFKKVSTYVSLSRESYNTQLQWLSLWIVMVASITYTSASCNTLFFTTFAIVATLTSSCWIIYGVTAFFFNILNMQDFTSTYNTALRYRMNQGSQHRIYHLSAWQTHISSMAIGNKCALPLTNITQLWDMQVAHKIDRSLIVSHSATTDLCYTVDGVLLFKVATRDRKKLTRMQSPTLMPDNCSADVAA